MCIRDSFCFGLLAEFDIEDFIALSAPMPITDANGGRGPLHPAGWIFYAHRCAWTASEYIHRHIENTVNPYGSSPRASLPLQAE